MWLTSLIPFPHTAVLQIDLHTAQCPFSLGLAVVSALECTKLEKTGRDMNESGRKKKNRKITKKLKLKECLTSLHYVRNILLYICDSLNNQITVACKKIRHSSTFSYTLPSKC